MQTAIHTKTQANRENQEIRKICWSWLSRLAWLVLGGWGWGVEGMIYRLLENVNVGYWMQPCQWDLERVVSGNDFNHQEKNIIVSKQVLHCMRVCSVRVAFNTFHTMEWGPCSSQLCSCHHRISPFHDGFIPWTLLLSSCKTQLK